MTRHAFDVHFRGRALRGAAVMLCLLGLCLALGGCSSSPVLAYARSSDEAVAQAVLDAIARRDTEELMRLALTQEEFEELVWPTLPASRPEVGMPSSYVWQDTFVKSRAYLGKTLNELGGQRLELVRVEFAGTTTEHSLYSLSRKSRLVVRDETGNERTIRAFGSIIRQVGRSKVYSYIVD